jgi:hypothetical protein
MLRFFFCWVYYVNDIRYNNTAVFYVIRESWYITQISKTLLHNSIILQWGPVWIHDISLIPPIVVECMYQIHVLSCKCGISILTFSTIFHLNFGIVLTVWYFYNIHFISKFSIIAIIFDWGFKKLVSI